MKVIFLGTPEFACNVLQEIINSKHQVVAVVCQPDKVSGRGNKVLPPPAKVLANQYNIPVYQFNKIRVDGVETLKSIDADIMVTAAYGQILSQEIIDICKHKIINVHGSLLPKLRGASPIQYSILNGDDVTGITIMRTEAGVDTGPILLQEKVAIDERDTYGTLSEKLSKVGAKLLVNALDIIESGKDTWTAQNDEEATFTKMIKPEFEMLDFGDTSKNIVNKVRALNPNPVAKMVFGEQVFKIFEAKSSDALFNNARIGEVVVSSPKQGLVIKCGDGAVEIVELQAPNGKRMSAKSYLNGKKIEVGSVVNE